MELTVFKNQYGYSTLAKNGDDKMYISVQFKKGNEPNTDRAKIKINNGFFSMYKNKVGIAFPKLVIMDYTIEGEQEYQNSFPSDNFVPPFDEDSLPF
jgi:hypothetical protein